jgi:hypothetical protein
MMQQSHVTVDLQLHGLPRLTAPSALPILRILVALQLPSTLPPERLRLLYLEEGTQLAQALSLHLPETTIDALVTTLQQLRGQW